MIETVINSCLHHQCLLAVTTHHPLTKSQSFIGMLTHDNNTKDKIRLHLYDGARHVFLYDDMGEKIYVTLKKAHIKSITPMHNIIYPNKISYGLLSHKTKIYNAYFFLRKNGIKKVTNLDDYHLTRSFMHENILSIKQTSRTIPILSYYLKYNAKNNTYDKTIYIHHEQSLHLFFHRVPNKKESIEDLVSRFKSFIKPHITVNEKTFNFIMKPVFKTIKPVMITHPMHHPYKALNQILTPKNLGRKTYILPPFTTSISALIQQTVMSSLTHPVTLSYLPYTLDDITKAYQNSALLNQKNALILAPIDKIKTLTPAPFVLPLINHTVLDKAIDRFLDVSDIVPARTRIPDIDYHDFFTAMTISNQKADYMRLLHYLNALFEDSAMNDYAIRVSALINQQEMTFSCDTRLLYTLNKYKKQTEAVLHFHETKHRTKLALPLYKEIYRVFMLKDKEKRRQEVLKWIHNPSILRRLKNIFPVIVTDEHTPLYSHNITFDMLVTYNNNNLAYYQLGLASKMTMITAYKPHLNYQQNSAVLAQQYTIFNQFNLSNNTTIKQLNLPSPLLNRIPIIHNVKAINYAKHTVYNHTEYIQKLRRETMEPLAIRTPFHAQKNMLKETLHLNDIKTIYRPTLKRLVLSLPVHPDMPQKTYDWIKNHPYIEQTLQHVPIDIIVDLEAVYHLTRSEDTLAQVVDDYYQADKKTHHITIDKAVDILLSTCLKHTTLTVREHVALSEVFSHLVIPKVKDLAYVLTNHTHNVVCVELPYHITRSQYQLLHQASRLNNVTLITYYKPHKNALDRLIKTLKTIDLIKAR